MSSIFSRLLLSLLVLLGVGGTGVVTYKTFEDNIPRHESATSTPADVEATTTAAKEDSPDAHTADVHTHTYAIDLTAIPLGDGKVSNEPKRGYVYSCTTSFRAGGAMHTGDWVNGETWNLTTKPTVFGEVTWPSATFSATLDGTVRTIKGNGLPVDHTTGVFPIAHADPAYQYDTNPNAIKAQTVTYELPSVPLFAKNPSCVPMGAIGYALNGVAIYNALDAAGRDAVAHEVQDECSAHPQSQGEYHYHGPSDCMPHADENNTLVGYALDGFGIYSRFNENGQEYTNADLDECHGIISRVMWDGKMQEVYHYVLTEEYPYTVGCFRGAPLTHQTVRDMSQPMGRNNNIGTNAPVGNEPPAAAVEACAGASLNTSCTFQAPDRTINGKCQIPPNQTDLICVPG